jgi:hypothetical protein
MSSTVFIARDSWLRDSYHCPKCRTLPRHRALVEVLNYLRPGWRGMTIHESSPSFSFFEKRCKRYSCSFYLEGVPRGARHNGMRCEDLENLTFADGAIDIFITQDVMEHVFDPARACREIMRVLRPQGLYIFTAPKHKHLLQSFPRAARIDGSIQHLHPAEYHGSPIPGERSLVTWDYGADFDDLVRSWTGYNVSDFILRDRNRGIDGEYLNVFAVVKDPANRADRPG